MTSPFRSAASMLLAALLAVALAAPAAWCQRQRKHDPETPAEVYKALADCVDADELSGTIHRLSSLPSRVTGYGGDQLARRWVREYFVQQGLEDVHEQPFRVAVPVDGGATLTIHGGDFQFSPPGREVEAGGPNTYAPDGVAWRRMDIETPAPTVPMLPLWPNLVRTSQLPAEGIRAPIIYAHGGALHEFDGKAVRGSVVLFDFNNGTDWFNALLLGAQAVIFIEPETTLRGEAEAKFLTTPIHLPRYYLTREYGLQLIQALESGAELEAELHCTMRWEKRQAFNIIGRITGTDRDLKHRVIVLQSYYDSMSVVPALAPGAETSCGLAALLQMVRVFRQYPPKRTIVFLATAAHFSGLSGVKAYFDDFIERPGDSAEVKARRAKRLSEIDAFIGLDLSSHTDRMGVFYKGYFVNQTEQSIQWQFSDIGKKTRETAEAAGKVLDITGDEFFVDGINPLKGKNWRTYLPGPLALSSEIATLTSRPGISFVTVDDARSRVDTPFDTMENVHVDRLVPQVRLLACVLYDLTNTIEDILDLELDAAFGRVSGYLYEFDPERSYLPDIPLPGSIAVMRPSAGGLIRSAKSLLGVRTDLVDIVGGDSMFFFPGAPGTKARNMRFKIEGFSIDPADGSIRFAADLGSTGAEAYPIEIPIDIINKQLTVVMFECRAMGIFDMIDQRQFRLLQRMYVYDAQTDAEPFAYGYSIPAVQPMVSYYEPCAVVFAEKGTRVKLTMGASLLGLSFILINGTDENWLGEGYLIDDHPTLPLTPYMVVQDMWRLDDHRIREFRRFGIENERVGNMHRTASEYLKSAKSNLAAMKYDSFFTDVRTAWSYETKAYPEVQKTTDDVVKGILFYLALLLPFAYFAERLFFSFPDIRWQIAGATGIFALVFTIIRFVHPAFSITITPLVVLLAFIILALTAIVSTIVVQKFEEQMRQIKFETGGMHSADVGRLSASAAAFSLGISNMRRRSTRTFLTCTTLIILTFTVLSFTSVVTNVRANKIDIKQKPPYPGIMVRQRSWTSLGEPTTRIIRNEFGGQNPVAPRGWYFSAMVGEQSFVNITANGKSYAATALVGFSPEETKVTDVSKALVPGSRWFTDDDVLGCIVPSGMAELLDIDPADIGSATVTVLGVEMPVIGMFDSDKFKEIRDLDHEHLTPVDYLLMQEQQRQQDQEVSEGELEEYIHLVPDAVLFVPFDFVMNHGGNLRSVAINFGDAKAVETNLESLMQRLELNLYAGVGDQTYLCSAVGMTSVGGMRDVLVPILIAALIVLNTMLGSVYERIREIGIYSSLGLAPVHIAALFMAEACVYALLGAISGYVFGQVLSKVVVSFNLVPGLNLNYSSLSAVGSVLLVMIVVILSTIYPSRKAAEMAVPDVERRWRLPDPEGDILDTYLPFSISSRHMVGVNAFLREYMEAHADYSLGHFSTEQVNIKRIETDYGPGVRLEGMVWLAPYDLGVSEYLVLDTVPTEDEFVNEVNILIRRESGDEASWLRTTRNFLNMLRKQFLIWRTFRPDLQQEYTETGKELIA